MNNRKIFKCNKGHDYKSGKEMSYLYEEGVNEKKKLKKNCHLDVHF